MTQRSQSITPLTYERAGWDALLLLAASHEDTFVRMEAAERLIRLGVELRPDLSDIDYRGHQAIARFVEQGASRLIKRSGAKSYACYSTAQEARIGDRVESVNPNVEHHGTGVVTEIGDTIVRVEWTDGRSSFEATEDLFPIIRARKGPDTP